MRIALLGADNDALVLVRHLVNSQHDQLAAVAVSTPLAAPLAELVPDAARAAEWESFLAAGDIDALIVAGGEDQSQIDQSLRKLVQAGVPLVIVHPLCDFLVAYELEMIRSDQGGILLPFFPGRSHPAFARLVDCVQLGDRSPVGAIEEVVMERCLADRPRPAVMRQLVRDVNVIRTLIGDVSSVSSIGAVSSDAHVRNLSVHLLGESGVGARWSLAAGRDAAGSLTLRGSRGLATVTMGHEGRAWSLDMRGDTPARQVFADWNEAAALFDDLRREWGGQRRPPTWHDVCQDLDLCETAERSLRRKRTIEFGQAERSEASAFKGLMAAGGCSLLMAAFFLLLVFALIEGFRVPLMADPEIAPAEDPRERWSLFIRLWPVYPLLAFLALQLLLLVARRPGGQGSDNQAKSKQDAGLS